MTKRKQALQDLRDKVAEGERFIDSEIVGVFGVFGPPEDGEPWDARSAYNGSLDAAKALHEAVLPGWSILLHGGHWGVQDYAFEINRAFKGGGRAKHVGRSEDPARAWLIAILKALIAQEPEA